MTYLTRVESVEEINALHADSEAIFVIRPDDRKIAALAKLKNLRKLNQDGNCFVTDQGLKTIATFHRLEELDLEWAENITDDGLQQLSRLSKLRWLDLGFCRNISDEGVRMLQNKLPSCEIVSSGK